MHYSKNVEVHAIGVVEAEKSEKPPVPREGHRYGRIKINVTASAHPIILVLMSYEPVLWDIAVSKRAVIEQVILGGYYAQEITGIDETIPLMVYTHYPSQCSNCFHGEGYLYSYKLEKSDFIDKVFEITGKKVTTFQGGHKGSSFNIMNNMPKIEYQHSVQKNDIQR
jgi:hypothetical protein